MKTRIIYPSLWDQDRVIDLSKNGKVLLFNLLTTGTLGLTKYLRTSDKRVILETGLTASELQKAREELTSCDIHYFEGWYFLGCDFAYLDYGGRDIVLNAKQKEIEAIPATILTRFEEVAKGLTTSKEPLINYKSKTINQKLGGVGDLSDEEVAQVAAQYQVPENAVNDVLEELKLYCQSTGKTYKDYRATLQTWVRRKVAEGKIKKVFVSPTTQYLEPIEVASSQDRQRYADEIRSNLSAKLSL